MDTSTLALVAAAIIIGVALGYYLRVLVAMGKRSGLELKMKQMLISAKEEAQKIQEEAKEKVEERMKEAEGKAREKEMEFKKTEDRLIKKEEFLDTRQVEIDKTDEITKEKEAGIEKTKVEIEALKEEEVKKLENVAKLSTEEALERLQQSIEKQYEEDILVRMQKLEQQSEEKLDKRAREILATAVQRYAGSTAGELTTTTVNIPSDNVKGKIIGKEGRNIRAFERAAGVELIVDDTPGTIIISGFDPVRRQVARLALENLILDGRIQPAKIEEFITKAQEDINKIIKQKGEEAVYETGVFNLDPRIVAILGRLYFRTSYGQNVLQHSIEMTHIAGMLAEELGADVQIAKAGSLVHDIGKALDHEVQGTHVDIGIRILEKFGSDPRVVTAMKSHHEDYPYETIESIIVQTADAISGGRPGARRETVENYLKRLEDLENIATSVEGVEKAYAISAGREIRIFVNPEVITDIEAREAARSIALKIEQELRYPGEIKVVVVRENRIIEFAR